MRVQINEEKLRKILDFIENPPISSLPSSKDHRFDFAVLCLDEMKYWESWRKWETDEEMLTGETCSEYTGSFFEVIGDKHFHFAAINHQEDQIEVIANFIRFLLGMPKKEV